MPLRRSHEIVGALVRKLVAEGREFDSLSTAEWHAASEHFGPDVVARVTPQASVGGGEANPAVDRARRRGGGTVRGGALAGVMLAWENLALLRLPRLSPLFPRQREFVGSILDATAPASAW